MPAEAGPPGAANTVTTCADFRIRAAAFFHRHGVDRIGRIPTDNAWATARAWPGRTFLASLSATGTLVRPCRPETNGKVEGFRPHLASVGNRELFRTCARLSPREGMTRTPWPRPPASSLSVLAHRAATGQTDELNQRLTWHAERKRPQLLEFRP
ncbi:MULTISPECIES: transposase family protein [unclassified Streptomyces]|uniref:transposase family protein n=1 Tax=unclassified Streptomyces TaxID=2593676 RepID=UPI000A84D3DC|nr:transposase family protein [Streptomyces sp. CNQ-509]